MNILKTKKGFTLIELLVVIGILAVLAAIAIPSVAGLIDRANVSADATNANEMTNAVERFVSEYELYVQDISSGRLNTENLDAAQGRVKNVTNVIDRAGIETLEKDATAGTDTTGRAIYRDTKYPVNAETMIAVVENYMKTSSTTFTPKQSDCHYYYSPDCGVVVCTETAKSSTADLNALIQSGKDAKGNTLGDTTQWIDLTLGFSSSSEIIAGAHFSKQLITTTCHEYAYQHTDSCFENGDFFLTWTELQLPENGIKYVYKASAINDTSIGNSAFAECFSLTSITIPDSVTSMGENMFQYCNNLTSITIPNSVTSIGFYAFGDCPSLTNINIPNSVTSIGDYAFVCCHSITSITIPDSVTSIGYYTLGSCSNLENITFDGTKAQWNAILLGECWNDYIPATVVHCTDGDVAI